MLVELLEKFILNILQIYPICGYIFAILFSLTNVNWIGIIYLIVGLSGEGLNYTLKKYVFTKDRAELFKRPKNMPDTGCKFFPNCNYKKDINNLPSGMPSGHAQTSFMFAVYWSLYLYQKYSKSKSDYEFYTMWTTIVILFIIAILVSYQRTYINCHTPIQVFAGSVIGSILGYIVYRVINRKNKDVVSIHYASISLGIVLTIMLITMLLLDRFIKKN